MEAVPRLPMLSFDLKVSPESTSFGPKLKQYIRDAYNEDPEAYSSEIHNLEGLRASAVCAPRDVTGCSILKRYYCQLHFLQSRFPMSKDGAAAVPFTWRDTYASMVCTLADIRFEMVSILYNIGALHSQLGASDSRVTADGMKLSCTHFQCAAWAFQHLKDTFPQPAGVDLAPDVMQFMYHLCLAQAQECILEKSMMDNRKATIIAKVAVQIVDYYNLALGILEQSGSDDCSVAETVGSKIYKNWKRYVKFKISYHSCVSLLYQGQQAEEQQKMGERVAYYQAASEKLEEAMKLCKGMDNIEAVNEALTFTMDVVEGKKKAAKNENEFIYHEEVPDRDRLPDVKGASLVKGIAFSVNDPDVSGPDIFSRLVPMKAHESASLYSEEKAKLLRRIGGMVEEKDQELQTFMASLQLEHLNISSKQDRLPQDLVDRCAALSAKPNAIQNLVDAMNKLADIYHDVECMLQEIQQLLEQEEKREKEYQQMMGKRPPSIVATDLTREANKYQEAHAKASESNQTLHKAMTLHISNLKILSQSLEDVQKHIPSLFLDSPADEAAEKEMQYLTNKVDEMRKSRAMLVMELRESVCKDDITHQLVTHTGESLDAVFSQEMEKHQSYVNLIEQNLTAQDNILKALTEAYARYAGTRKAVSELVRKRDATINALISSYDAYEDLLAKSSKGLEFYRKLETNVNKLLQRVKGTVKVQEEEREQILAKNKKTEVESAAPKLKDYLQGMKQGATGYVSGYAAQVPAAYYNTNVAAGYAPVASPQPQVPAESSIQQQFVPAVRPAPVGSEGTSEQTIAVKFDTGETEIPKHSGVAMKMAGYPATTYSTSTQYSYTDTYPYTQDARSYAYAQQYYASDKYAADQKSKESASYYGALTQTQLPSSSDYQSTGQYAQWQQQQYYQYQLPVSGVATTSVPASNYSQYQTSTTQAVSSMYPAASTASQNLSSYQTPGMSATAAASNYGQYQTSTAQSGSSMYSAPSTASQNLSSYQTPVTQGPGLSATAAASNYGQYQTAPIQPVTSMYAASTSSYQMSAGHTPGLTSMAASSNYSQYQTSPTQSVTAMYSVASMSSYQMPSGQATGLTSTAVPSNYGQYQTATTQAVSSMHAAATTASQNLSSYQMPAAQAPGLSSTAGPSNYNQYQNPTSTTLPSSVNLGYQTATTQSYQTSMPSVGLNQYQITSQTPSSSLYQTTASSSSLPQYQITTQSSDSSVHQTPNSMSVGANEYQYQYPYTYSPQVSGDMTGKSTEFQYMTSPGNSCYTNAGTYNTSQTCSAQAMDPTHYDGSSYQAQTPYYSLPYGYQYGADAATTSGTVVQSPQSYEPQQNTNQSQSTYMQASGQNDSTTTTYSQQGSNGGSLSSSQTGASCNGNDAKAESNVDLLAGLDFSLNQAPLVPQQQSGSTTLKKEEEDKSTSSPVKQITNVPITKTVETAPNESSKTSEMGTVDKQPSLELTQEEAKVPKSFGKDPYADPEALNQFVQEVGKYEKFVDGLTTKTLNGPTPLDMKWKELLELQEKDAHKRSISVARCYPMKNRFSDILPYDHSRVELPSTKDDYINASYIKNLTSATPPFIATQAPLPSTYSDFWTMVWEQQVEVIVCLLNDTELQGQIYWPAQKGEELVMGKMKLTLQSSNVRAHWAERIISIYIAETRASRVIVHLQLTVWPGSSFPPSPGPFLCFVSEALNLYMQQRGASHPVVVHCLSGVGRTGLFCLVAAALCEIQAGRGLLDLVTTTATMSTFRKAFLRDREHLKFAYQAVLYYAQDLLMKRAANSSNDKKNSMELQDSNTRWKPQDPFSELDPYWPLKK